MKKRVKSEYAISTIRKQFITVLIWKPHPISSPVTRPVIAPPGVRRWAELAKQFSKRIPNAGAAIIVSTLPPFPVFVALNFVWGIGAGITMTQSRTVVQIVAPPTHRARLMSLFQLGLGGGGPIGAFLTGTICSLWGLKVALLLPALAMLLLIALVLLRSRLWTMRTVE